MGCCGTKNIVIVEEPPSPELGRRKSSYSVKVDRRASFAGLATGRRASMAAIAQGIPIPDGGGGPIAHRRFSRRQSRSMLAHDLSSDTIQLYGKVGNFDLVKIEQMITKACGEKDLSYQMNMEQFRQFMKFIGIDNSVSCNVLFHAFGKLRRMAVATTTCGGGVDTTKISFDALVYGLCVMKMKVCKKKYKLCFACWIHQNQHEEFGKSDVEKILKKYQELAEMTGTGLGFRKFGVKTIDEAAVAITKLLTTDETDLSTIYFDEFYPALQRAETQHLMTDFFRHLGLFWVPTGVLELNENGESITGVMKVCTDLQYDEDESSSAFSTALPEGHEAALDLQMVDVDEELAATKFP